MERVEEALRSVNGLLRGGMDWGDVEKLIAHERGRGNPVAEIIVGCKFAEGKIVLGLREEQWDEGDSGDETDEEEGESEEGQVVKIDVDLGLSAWANARQYFDKKKVAAEKVYPFNRRVYRWSLFSLLKGPDCRNREPHNLPPKLSKMLNERLQLI
jgi:hypothetical protein